MTVVDRAENLPHIIPSLDDWPINQFAKDRDGFVERLITYTLGRLDDSGHSAHELLSKTIYLEIKRSKNNPWKVDPSDEKAYWKSLSKEFEATKALEDPQLEQIKILKRVVHRYSEEILGDFNPKTFRFARKFLTSLFKRLLNNGWGKNHKGIWGNRDNVRKKIKVDGHVEEVRKLFNKGTVVIVPTHYSNLDSPLIGYTIDMKLAIPAFAYGAGLNLYDYELVAYFINRLGAYRVDRRKKNPIYLETLKSMASLSLIEGVNHIFFPGGTRSRSGAIEDKLKLGLLNSVIDAQRHCIFNDIPQKLFVVPMAVSYHFVPEAKALIEQHLRSIGREKYSRTKIKNSKVSSFIKFLKNLRNKDSEVFVSIGKPMDVLGNAVNKEGESHDHRGQPVDVKNYFKSNNQLNVDNQRESIYTRILADKILDSFKKESVVLTSHVLAFSMFSCLQDENPESELFEILKIPVKNISVPISVVKEKIGYVMGVLKSLDFEVKFTPEFEEGIDMILDDGMKNMGIYHTNPPIYKLNEESLSSKDLKVLYYYHNKLEHYEITYRKSEA
jgi:glycerol-3-phosphate O-acyltransferase